MYGVVLFNDGGTTPSRLGLQGLPLAQAVHAAGLRIDATHAPPTVPAFTHRTAAVSAARAGHHRLPEAEADHPPVALSGVADELRRRIDIADRHGSDVGLLRLVVVFENGTATLRKLARH